MKQQRESLIEESRDRFMELAGRLRGELKKLYDEGVLTKMDWMKLTEDSELSAQAVISAINRNDLPPEMQKELVKNLINQYEVSTEQILQDARYRRYTPERIEERLDIYEKPVLTNWGNALDAQTINQRQYQDVMNRLKAMHRDAVNGICSIPQKHPKRTELIESWLDEYRQQMEKLAITPTPRLSYAPSREVSSHSSDHSENPSHSVPDRDQPNMTITQEKPQGLLRKIILSVFKK